MKPAMSRNFVCVVISVQVQKKISKSYPSLSSSDVAIYTPHPPFLNTHTYHSIIQQKVFFKNCVPRTLQGIKMAIHHRACKFCLSIGLPVCFVHPVLKKTLENTFSNNCCPWLYMSSFALGVADL